MPGLLDYISSIFGGGQKPLNPSVPKKQDMVAITDQDGFIKYVPANKAIGGSVLGANTQPTPTPTPTPSPKRVAGGGRSKNWINWKKLNPKGFQELLSGATLASKKYNVPVELLMDISGFETSGGQNLDQFGGGPGQGYFMFEPSTLKGLNSYINPYSATESAMLAAKLINSGQLSRWGIPRDQAMKEYGKYWGTLDNPNNKNGSLTDLYSKEELNKYLSPKFQLR